MNKSWIRIAVASGAAVFCVSSLIACTAAGANPATNLAQGATTTPNFNGTDLPITLAPKDLGSDFRPLKLKEQGTGIFGDYYGGSYFQFSSLGIGPGTNNQRVNKLLEILPVAWTKDEVVKVYGQDFVVTYILEPALEDLRAFTEGKPLKSAMLKLKLMKADQIASIEPFPELNREKYIVLLTELSEKPGLGAVSPAVQSAALSNAKQVSLAMIMWSADNDDLVPYVQSSRQLRPLLNPYLKNDEIWKTLNPRDDDTSFVLNMSLSGASMMDVQEPAATPMIYDPKPWPDGTRTVSFVDGHAKRVSEADWKGMQKYLKLKLKRHGKPIK